VPVVYVLVWFSLAGARDPDLGHGDPCSVRLQVEGHRHLVACAVTREGASQFGDEELDVCKAERRCEQCLNPAA
jgi:hypothetical protein